jgi:AmmeMemoRadiSam system protein B
MQLAFPRAEVALHPAVGERMPKASGHYGANINVLHAMNMGRSRWECNFVMWHRAEKRVRPPAVSGSFYPREPQVLRSELLDLMSKVRAPELKPPLGLIAPHAGYMYSGPVAATAFAGISALRGRVGRVLLLGPPHYAPVRRIAAPSSTAFATPLGEVPLDQKVIGELVAADLIDIDDAAHALEHALEVELPFLQLLLGGFSLVPLLVGDAAPEQTAAVIEAVQESGALLVISTDLSHYLSYNAARARDAATAESIERRDFARLSPSDACGFSALNGALCAAAKHGWTVTRLDLRNSGDTSGDRRRVVGYGAWSFTAALAVATS